VIAADQLQGALIAGRGWVGNVVDGDAEAADLLQPPPDVPAAVAAGQAAMAADGQRHRPARPGQLVGQLDA